jgi:hypothetical protein
MLASLKFLLRLFFLFSYAFGFVMGLCATVALLAFYLITGEGGWGSALLIGLGVAVGGGTFYGLLMTLFLGGWQILAVWRRGFPLTSETLAVCQTRRLTVELPFAEAFSLCTASIRYLGKTDVEEETDFGQGVILAVKRWTMKSWGERIRFQLSHRQGGTTVLIECQPLRQGALVDGGSSLENLDAIVGFLLAHGANAEGSHSAAIAGKRETVGRDGAIQEDLPSSTNVQNEG